MNPPLSALDELEMLDGVGHVHLAPLDAGFVESAVEKLAGGTDEGMSQPIFTIAGLLADEHYARASVALTEDGLGSKLVKIAAATTRGGLSQALERAALG